MYPILLLAKRLSLAVVPALALYAAAPAVTDAAPITLVQYTFNDGTQNTDSPTTLAAGVSADDLVIGPGVTTTGYTPSTFDSNAIFRQGQGLNANNGSNIDTAGPDLTDYFGFSFSGTDLEISGFSFRYASDTNGPRRYQVRYSLDGFNTGGTTFASGEISPAAAPGSSSTDLSQVSALQNINGPVAIRVYMWGAASSSKWGRVDDLTVTGTVVPEPTAFALFGLTAVAMGKRRRRA